MGWREGSGLGPHGAGTREPLALAMAHRAVADGDYAGLGMREHMQRVARDSTAQRKESAAERIAAESQTERLEREAKVQKLEAIREDIKSVQAAFYCELCDKQYTKISDYESHLSSYDHHHCKRFKEMQELSKKGALPGQQRQTNREQKEHAREEMELQRIMLAAAAKSQSKASVSAAPDAAAVVASGSGSGSGSASVPSDAPSAAPKKPLSFGLGPKKPAGASQIKFAFGKK
eukprot:jgi/Hompol1/14/HPOL_001681-RA